MGIQGTESRAFEAEAAHVMTVLSPNKPLQRSGWIKCLAAGEEMLCLNKSCAPAC